MAKAQYFSLNGDIFLKEKGTTANPRFIGNVSEGKFAMTRSTIVLKSTGNVKGDLAEEETDKSAELSLTLNSMAADNLAIVLYGLTIDQAASATPVAFTLPAMSEGEIYKLSKVNVSAVTITGAVEGIDYTVLPLSGIIVALKSIVAGKAGTFTNGAAKATGMFKHTGKEYEVHYASENSGKYIVFARWKPNPATDFNLISSEFAKFTIAGKLLVDASIASSDLGGYAAVYDSKASI